MALGKGSLSYIYALNEKNDFLNTSKMIKASWPSIFQHTSVVGIILAMCLVSIKGTLAISVDPDQTPQNAASGQVLYCLYTKNWHYSIKEKNKIH